MKVAELIALLQECPQDGEVFVFDPSCEYCYLADKDITPTAMDIRDNPATKVNPAVTANDVVIRPL